MPVAPCTCDTADLGRAGGAPVDTLIFVDVDGVLNIGIEDPGEKPLDFDFRNVQRALEMWGAPGDWPAFDATERIVSTYHHDVGHGESSTFAEYQSSTSLGACEKLVGRLAQLIQVAGDRCAVVLSSSWRHPRYTKKRRQLEHMLLGCLGQSFAFHAATALVPDVTPEMRLRTIGDFIADHGKQLPCSPGGLRVLVLEDFHITAMDGWLCGEVPMDSTAAAERYLLSRIPAFVKASVKLVHTFGSWTTPSGLVVRVGTGLTKDHLCQAMKFLGYHNCPHCSVHL